MGVFNEIIYTKEEIQQTLDNMNKLARINKELAIEALEEQDQELFAKKYFSILKKIKALESKLNATW